MHPVTGYESPVLRLQAPRSGRGVSVRPLCLRLSGVPAEQEDPGGPSIFPRDWYRARVLPPGDLAHHARERCRIRRVIRLPWSRAGLPWAAAYALIVKPSVTS